MRSSFILLGVILLASCAKETKVVEVKVKVPHRYLISEQQDINHGNNYVYSYIPEKKEKPNINTSKVSKQPKKNDVLVKKDDKDLASVIKGKKVTIVLV